MLKCKCGTSSKQVATHTARTAYVILLIRCALADDPTNLNIMWTGSTWSVAKRRVVHVSKTVNVQKTPREILEDFLLHFEAPRGLFEGCLKAPCDFSSRLLSEAGNLGFQVDSRPRNWLWKKKI